MKNIDTIISIARERTNNTAYTTTAGMSQNLLVEFANDGQSYLQAAIINQYPQNFIDKTYYTIIGNESVRSAGLTLPDNAFGGGRIVTVHYSSSGNERDFIRLKPRTLVERSFILNSFPDAYIRAGSEVYLDPLPSVTNSIARISYYRELDRVDVSRGPVTAAAGAAISFTPNTLQPVTANDEYISICKFDGTPMLYGAPIASVVGTTITTTAALTTYLITEFVLADLVGGIVCIGKYATNKSKLPNNCEQYLRTYLQKRMLNKDSNGDEIAEDSELKDMLAVILTTYAQPTEDVYDIPITDTTFL